MIRNGRQTGSGVFQREILIVEAFAVDGQGAGAIAVDEIAALTHEAGNDAMKGRILVAEALLAGAQSAEILGRPRHHIGA